MVTDHSFTSATTNHFQTWYEQAVSSKPGSRRCRVAAPGMARCKMDSETWRHYRACCPLCLIHVGWLRPTVLSCPVSQIWSRRPMSCELPGSPANMLWSKRWNPYSQNSRDPGSQSILSRLHCIHHVLTHAMWSQETHHAQGVAIWSCSLRAMPARDVRRAQPRQHRSHELQKLPAVTSKSDMYNHIHLKRQNTSKLNGRGGKPSAPWRFVFGQAGHPALAWAAPKKKANCLYNMQGWALRENSCSLQSLGFPKHSLRVALKKWSRRKKRPHNFDKLVNCGQTSPL